MIPLWRIRQRIAILVDDHRLVPAHGLLWVLEQLYRTKDNALAFELRLVANRYDTRPREWP